MNVLKRFGSHWAVYIAAACMIASPLLITAQEKLGGIVREIDPSGFPKPVPVYVSGYSGDVDPTLKNDLLFLGIDAVSEDKAQYTLSGKADATQVEGTLMDKFNKNYLLRKAYRGGTTRQQVHTLADEVAAALGLSSGLASSKIAFKAKRGANFEVFIADYDGANPQQVTSDNTIVAGPCWSGKSTLYYTSYKQNNPDIYMHRLASGERRAVSRSLGLNGSPAVSPNGSMLAMILSKPGNPELYVADAQGGNARRLTNTPAEESSPCWSPDGREICYVSKSSGVNRLYRVPAGGGTPKAISTSGLGNCTEPDWSPDGKWIAFTSQAGNYFRVCIVPAAGGEARIVADGEDPSWGPNSRAIVFARRENNRRVLSLLDAHSKRVKDVARIWESSSQPSWSR